MDTFSNCTLPKGYVWKCIADPSGIFRGRFFRTIDITVDPHDDGCCWDEGTTWVNVATLERKTIHNGQTITLSSKTAPTYGRGLFI